MATQDQTKMYKFSMFIKRRPDLTEVEFHEYWTETHAPIVDEWLAKHGVVRYIQYHLRSDACNQSEKIWTGLGGENVLDFDGQVELLVPNVECLQEALDDPYYKGHVQPDEEKFIDANKSYKTCGWEEKYIHDGCVVREERKQGNY
ncbi:EthD domain-containing protein [Lophiotrema nucula]|uniref:EthD domain-containing protein n=1 Tax=Lophiotrema nucula TaxID=690887 RepID=A0A6A5YIA5_9PLEO|nr:EthD domain-containing protein [Lophiotrema nucula]